MLKITKRCTELNAQQPKFIRSPKNHYLCAMKTARFFCFLCVTIMFFSACSNRLSEKKTIAILSDFYLYNELPNKLGYAQKDSVSLYLSLFDKHGVSQKQFDRTMEYYIKHPKKMNELYAQLDSIARKEVDFYAQAVEDCEMANNLWFGHLSFSIDSVQIPDKISFHLPIDSLGNYTMKVNVAIPENDSTKLPQMVGYFLSRIENHKRDTINRKTVTFYKSEKPLEYVLKFSIQDTTVNAFEGYWLSVENDTIPVRQHIKLEKLRVLYNNDSTKTISADVLRPTRTLSIDKEAKDSKNIRPAKKEETKKPQSPKRLLERQSLQPAEELRIDKQ